MNEVVKKYFRKEILQEACKRFGIDVLDANLIRSNSNLIYDCGDRILRLSHSKIRDYNDIEVEVNWMHFLRSKNLSIVNVRRSNNNKIIEKIGGTDHFSIVCFDKINGVKITEENWGEEHFQKLGKILGTLHKTGQEYEYDVNLNYKHWNEIDEYKKHIYLDNEHGKLHEELVEEFKSYARTSENYGLIHYDIHHGNYLMVGAKKQIILFDFEMVCKSWYANDIATVVYYAKHFPQSREEENFEGRFLNSFWKGYEKEFSIEEEEKMKIPKFLLYRDLLLLGFLNNLWDLNNLEKNQKWMIDRIKKSILKRQKVLKK